MKAMVREQVKAKRRLGREAEEAKDGGRRSSRINPRKKKEKDASEEEEEDEDESGVVSLSNNKNKKGGRDAFYSDGEDQQPVASESSQGRLPTSSRHPLSRAEKQRAAELAATERKRVQYRFSEVTPLGTFLSKLPFGLEIGRLIAFAITMGPQFVPHAVVMASSLSMQEIFVMPHPMVWHSIA